jgi:vancomycin permeability regulator SanA
VIEPAGAPELPSANLIVILGCAVKSGGAPSDSMRRRVDGALSAARHLERVVFMPVGGVGRHPPAEAFVMQALLEAAGIPRGRIQPVPAGKNTIESLRACWPQLRREQRTGAGAIAHVCTDDYHMLRCRAILWIWGLVTRPLPCPEPRRGWPLLFMRARDRVGLAKDIPLALLWRLGRRLPTAPEEVTSSSSRADPGVLPHSKD